MTQFTGHRGFRRFGHRGQHAGGGGGSPPPPPVGSFRNPYTQPFAVDSVWNTPIGSFASYSPANLSGSVTSGWGTPSLDEDHVILTPTETSTAINGSTAGWGASSRCTNTDGLMFNVPMPGAYTVADHSFSGSSSHQNDCAAWLNPDFRTLIQNQPLARCTANQPGTCLTGLSFANQDFYGQGEGGSHGGSGLSSLGGTLRVNDLGPATLGTGPRHALRLNVDESVLWSGSPGFFWPATKKDSYAYTGSNSNLRIGSLLAIPPSVDITAIGLVTDPAKQLAWTLQNYGCYICDTWNSNVVSYALCCENGPNGSWRSQFQTDYGWDPNQHKGGGAGNELLWQADFALLMTKLQIVTNNSPTTKGGGGTPRQALADPFSASFRAEAHAFSAATTSLSINVPTNVNGDLLIANIACIGTTTITPPAGWTLIQNSSSGILSTDIQHNSYWHAAQGEPASYAWTSLVSGAMSGHIWSIKDVKTSAPINTSTTNTGTGTTVTGSSITPTLNNTLLLYLAANFAAISTWAPTSFWSQGTAPIGANSMQAIGNYAAFYDTLATGNITTTTNGAAGNKWSVHTIAITHA